MPGKQVNSLRLAQLALLAVAAGCILYGIHRGEAVIVLKKAVNICLECIGLG